MTTEPGTPQTATGREQLARVPEYMKPEVSRQLCAIEAEARAARDAEWRERARQVHAQHDLGHSLGAWRNACALCAAILDADTAS